ncbi:MAG: citrate/2-methylcitrate synthase [Desulfobacterales bacterium]
MDGEAGKLIYRGYPIFDLSDKTSFEEIVHLLLYESLPDETQLADLAGRLKENRAIRITWSALKTRPADALPMDISSGSHSHAGKQ